MKAEKSLKPHHPVYFDRDLSWLSFNERVLNEARREGVPLMEKIRFLGIYSSNLDEFYRVRMPALMALGKLDIDKQLQPSQSLLDEINTKILAQQKFFGSIIENEIIGGLRAQNIRLIYNEAIPEVLLQPLQYYFIHQVAAYIRITPVSPKTTFFPENNKLYNLVTIEKKKTRQWFVINIPSDVLPRFYVHHADGIQYIVFLDDVIKLSLPLLFPGQKIAGSYNFKTTRDAEIDLQDEFSGNLARKIEKKLAQRDRGLPTRFLYEPGIDQATLSMLRKRLNLKGASCIKGGAYHNLKDLSTLPLKDPRFNYEPWPHSVLRIPGNQSLFDSISSGDILLHTPYQSYDTVLRFFNEASIDPGVEKIFITLYRIAHDSKIAEALISAAHNGKKVTVFVELKARFDEANNIRWSKRMKAAGIRIIESIPGLKVHAKLALVTKKRGSATERLGIVATGNFNEGTARYYTDHLLMTADQAMLKEAEALFRFLKKRKKQSSKKSISFRHLLVGQFNLQQRFLDLIDREIKHAALGLPSSVIVKLNNLEDKVLIAKLYEASQQGVQIQLIVRSICCLVPGVKGMSENICVKRIVDRYLEHGRVFVFHNNGAEEVFIGSADWMNRNIYRRIEVCVPIKEPALKTELLKIVNIQLNDDHQTVILDEQCRNTEVAPGESPVRSQRVIGEMLYKETESRET